jgi:hypothetical protein
MQLNIKSIHKISNIKTLDSGYVWATDVTYDWTGLSDIASFSGGVDNYDFFIPDCVEWNYNERLNNICTPPPDRKESYKYNFCFECAQCNNLDKANSNQQIANCEQKCGFVCGTNDHSHLQFLTLGVYYITIYGPTGSSFQFEINDGNKYQENVVLTNGLWSSQLSFDPNDFITLRHVDNISGGLINVSHMYV